MTRTLQLIVYRCAGLRERTTWFIGWRWAHTLRMNRTTWLLPVFRSLMTMLSLMRPTTTVRKEVRAEQMIILYLVHIEVIILKLICCICFFSRYDQDIGGEALIDLMNERELFHKYNAFSTTSCMWTGSCLCLYFNQGCQTSGGPQPSRVKLQP